MSDIEDFGGPINRPASNARQGTPGDLGHTPQAFGQDAQDFLGLGGGTGSDPTSGDPFAQPAVQPPTPPSDSWLLESADEAPVTIPRSIAASKPVEPPALLNTSWSEPERKGSKGRWVGALLGVASLGALALIGYPRLVKRLEPVQERDPRVAQSTPKPAPSVEPIDESALALVADDLDTPGAIEPADEYSAPLATATPVERALVGGDSDDTHSTTALEDSGLVEVVDPTAATEMIDAEALASARKERNARRRALKAELEAQKLEHELALAAMNADCEPETQPETADAGSLASATTPGDTGPTELEASGESATKAVAGSTPQVGEPKSGEDAWPGVSWLDEIEQLANRRPGESTEEPTTDGSEAAAPEAPVASDVDTTWLDYEGTGSLPETNDAEAELRADAKRERRAAARAARWRAREEALEAARLEHEASLAGMNAACAPEAERPTVVLPAADDGFWTPALGELPLPGSWAETAPKAPLFEGPAGVASVSADAPSSSPLETAEVEATPVVTSTPEAQPSEIPEPAAATTEVAPNVGTPIDSAPVASAPTETRAEATTPVEAAPVTPAATPTIAPVATAPALPTPSEPTKPTLGPPAPNGVPPSTPTGVEGATAEADAKASGNERVTQLSVQAVVQPTRAPSTTRVATADERKGVWDGDTIPLEEISRKTRLLTPKVGKVRATLTSGELFEGTLYGVGEDCVWIDTSYGRMGLAGARVKSVVRIEIPKDPSKPDAPKAPEPERVHIKTPGGTVAGQLLEDDGKHAIVLTDSGARVTVDSASIQRLGDQAPTVRVQQRKQP